MHLHFLGLPFGLLHNVKKVLANEALSELPVQKEAVWVRCITLLCLAASCHAEV